MRGLCSLGAASALLLSLLFSASPASAVDCPIENLTEQATKSQRRGLRAESGIDAIVLHQTGSRPGIEPSDYRREIAHYVVTPSGRIAQIHPHTARIDASHGFNRRSIAVAVAGNFPTEWDQWSNDHGGGQDEVTGAQIAATRCLLKKLQADMPQIQYVLAHRQAAASESNDPGPDVWLEVAEWAKRELKLEDGGPKYKIEDGRPIPDAWRERRATRTQYTLCDPLLPFCGPGNACQPWGDGHACFPEK